MSINIYSTFINDKINELKYLLDYKYRNPLSDTLDLMSDIFDSDQIFLTNPIFRLEDIDILNILEFFLKDLHRININISLLQNKKVFSLRNTINLNNKIFKKLINAEYIFENVYINKDDLSSLEEFNLIKRDVFLWLCININIISFINKYGFLNICDVINEKTNDKTEVLNGYLQNLISIVFDYKKVINLLISNGYTYKDIKKLTNLYCINILRNNLVHYEDNIEFIKQYLSYTYDPYYKVMFKIVDNEINSYKNNTNTFSLSLNKTKNNEENKTIDHLEIIKKYNEFLYKNKRFKNFQLDYYKRHMVKNLSLDKPISNIIDNIPNRLIEIKDELEPQDIIRFLFNTPSLNIPNLENFNVFKLYSYNSIKYVSELIRNLYKYTDINTYINSDNYKIIRNNLITHFINMGIVFNTKENFLDFYKKTIKTDKIIYTDIVYVFNINYDGFTKKDLNNLRRILLTYPSLRYEDFSILIKIDINEYNNIEDIKREIRKLTYEKYNIKEKELIKYFIKYKISDKHFKRYIKLYNKIQHKRNKNKLESIIPNIRIVDNNYIIKTLEKGNTYNLFIGLETDCCMEPYNVGKSCLKHGLLGKNSNFIGWFKDDELIAQSWVWSENNILVFDSIEAIRGVNIDKVSILLLRYVKEAIDKHNIKEVRIGESNCSITEYVIDKLDTVKIAPISLSNYRGYTDAKEQVKIIL